jgi:putative ABC transport system permease protein
MIRGRWIHSLRLRLRASVRPAQSDKELDDELAFHVAMQAQENVDLGMSQAEANRRARLALGGVQQLKEGLRDQRSVPWLDHLRQDVRYAIRTILRTKAVSAAVILTFALGIGANTAIFSLINSVLLTPLPYDGADRIVAVEPFWTNTGRTTPVSSAPDFRDWRDQNQVLDYLAFHAGREIRLVVDSAPSFASVQLVSPDFFNVFGMAPIAGRMWTEAEDSEAAPLAIVNYEWAVARFGDAHGALGQTVEALGRAAEVIGVASPGFRYPGSTEVWMPSTLIPINENRGGHNYFVVGRLKAGITLEDARSDLRAIADRLAKAYPDNRLKSVAVTPMLEKLTSGAQTTLWLLLATVIGVMLIACVNVAHLQLARAAARTREMSVRSAIGAAPGRIARQVLTENVVIGLAGSVVGLAVGWLTLRTFLAAAPADIPRLNEVHVDMRVFLFTLVVTLVCSLLFGVGPARRASRSDVIEGLRYQTRSTVASVAPRVRSALVMAEVALSLVLLIASGLLLRSFVQLRSVDLGFATDRVLVTTAAYPIAPGFFPDTRATYFYRDLLAEVRTLPGVRQAAGAMTMPFVLLRPNSGYTIEGGQRYRPEEAPMAQIQVITPGYFETMNTPIRAGRDFRDDDESGQPQVAIVNERLAREAFGSGNPLGRIIRTGMTPESSMGMEIVGVVADARQIAPHQPARPEIYLPYLQHPGPGSLLTLVTRTSLEPDSLMASIRRASRQLNPGVPVRFSTMDDVLNEALSYPRFRTMLVSAFALLAVVLALVGIYSVLSYLVTEQTPEIGVRLALGAHRRDIFRRVIGGSMRLLLGGVIVGLVIALVTVRAIETMLFDVSARDPLTIAAVIVLLTMTALAASGLPALRAASVDPLVALRDE